jgi:uncharacterized repeat protein (TIGR01451 family)
VYIYNKLSIDGLYIVRRSPKLRGIRVAMLISGAAASVLCSGIALADPAPNAASFTQSTAGSIAAQTVPDGTCRIAAIVKGGSGASQGTGGTGGRGAGGATINATFDVLPLQSLTGTVAGGGLAAAGGGTGASAGGAGGTASQHRGAGGGGSSVLSAAGQLLVHAGGGGGGAAAHDATPAGNGGAGGALGIGAGVVAAGVAGANGTDGPGIPNGGQGGQTTAGGIGGVSTSNAANNGFTGGSIGAGAGGNGGNDGNADSGGGGGGGYTGGGGGASTTSSTVSGAGGGGGSSFVRATAATAAGATPTAISGSAGVPTAQGAVNGAAGVISIDYIPCQYTLGVSKSVSATTVSAGGKVVWTVAVTNSGPDPMTRGDILSLADTLPSGPNAPVSPVFKVLSVGTSGGSNANLARTAFSCTGVTVGGSMPSSTNCSRPYSAASSPGAPSGGSRGLDSGETLTITYEQVISNTATCQVITNTASTTDRSSRSGTTDIIGVNAARSANQALTVQCYDLAITKTATPGTVLLGQDVSWSVTVNNNGAAAMKGPDDPTPNPLIVTDVAPTVNLSAPFAFTSTGPAGLCTYSTGTITCPQGLGTGEGQTFTFRQTVAMGAAAGASISNTASVTDAKAGDTNDSATSQFIVGGLPPVVQAVNDSVTGIDGVSGAANVVNAYTGDTINGATATASNATLALAPGATVPAGLTFDAATGNVSVGVATPAGVYSFDYQLCDRVSPTSCNIGTVTVTVVGAPLADLAITKSNGTNGVTAGTATSYSLTITNIGPASATGALVRDTPGGGITCPAAGLVTISGDGVPPGSFTIGDLTGAGIALGTLTSGQSAALTYSCTVVAS